MGLIAITNVLTGVFLYVFFELMIYGYELKNFLMTQ